MPGRRIVSQRQQEIMIAFLETHPDIALGRFPSGPQASQVTRQTWESLALKLNALADGVSKTPDQWCRCWIELKAKIKAKAADSRRNASVTSGGPSKLIPLSAIEERVLALIGPVVRRRSLRRIRRDERVPRWAYELELRRLDIEERHAAALERIAAAIENYSRQHRP